MEKLPFIIQLINFFPLIIIQCYTEVLFENTRPVQETRLCYFVSELFTELKWKVFSLEKKSSQVFEYFNTTWKQSGVPYGYFVWKFQNNNSLCPRNLFKLLKTRYVILWLSPVNICCENFNKIPKVFHKVCPTTVFFDLLMFSFRKFYPVL